MRKTEYSYLVDKYSKLPLKSWCFIPLLFYLHEMALVIGNTSYDELACTFIKDFQKQLDEL